MERQGSGKQSCMSRHKWRSRSLKWVLVTSPVSEMARRSLGFMMLRVAIDIPLENRAAPRAVRMAAWAASWASWLLLVLLEI